MIWRNSPRDVAARHGHPARVPLGGALLTLLALAVLAAPAAAHARLLTTSPAGGATVDEAPREVRLTFSEAIETTFAGVQVFGPQRQRVESGEARVEGEKVAVPLRRDLPGGRYTVVFRVISADGHPVRSQFRFTYDAPTDPPGPPPSEATAAPSPAPTEVPADPATFELEDAGPGTTVGLWASRLLNYVALTAVAGMLLTALYLLPGAYDTAHRRWLRRAAVGAAGWAATSLVLFAFALSSVAARPLPEALDGDLAARFLETRFGVTVLLQAGLALVCALLAAAARSRGVALATAATAGLAAATIPWWGHAGTDELPAVALLSAFVHVTAAAAWVGGLAVLVTALRRTSGAAATVAQRFSRVAGGAFVLVAASGVVNTALHLGALENLWDTGWGRLVIGKVVVIAVVGGFAWRNRNVLLPRIAQHGDAARHAFRRFAAGEVAVMLVALGLAAGLASGIPADAEAAGRIQSVASQFGDGQINVTIDPAEVGANVVHVYFLTADGAQRQVSNPSLTFTTQGTALEAQLFAAGPGHYTVLSQQFPVAGEYEMTLSADVDGETVSTTSTIVVR